MKRRRDEAAEMEIVWQTPANPPERRDYIFRNGKRHVRPYYFEFISHVKNRWAGKTIVDLFTEEFKGRPYDYYVNAVQSGRIQVDGEMVPVSYIVRSSQKISHFVHRHEPPVLALDVSVLQKEPDVLTICKPASVPVHPCGQYRKNTVVGILQAEHGLAPLFLLLLWISFLPLTLMSAIHRLDRLVSGLLILARSASKADSFRQQIEAGWCRNSILQRSLGYFLMMRYSFVQALVGNCCGNTPLKGKSACTKFTRISTNGTHSIVLCEPITGRTHQLVIMNNSIILLPWLKERSSSLPSFFLYQSLFGVDSSSFTIYRPSIANDMLYLSEFSVDRSTKGLSADRAAANSGCSLPSSSPKSCVDEYCDDNSTVDFSIDPMCTNCPNLTPKGYDEDEEGLWLHCIRYSGPDWVYECPHPEWASHD
ncbi:RNA pseudouridine synthase 7 [Vitis vinifera]|uniref:RNA pseudouridine synthase 7 n=1 Tax=Vitis vinifera TaxID=29760 RepID=A0A438K9T9_VITVI|nr:RNA pseudouridine synthase 7 [Vitis vinifera]